MVEFMIWAVKYVKLWPPMGMDGSAVVHGGSLLMALQKQYADRPERFVVRCPRSPAVGTWGWGSVGVPLNHLINVGSVVRIGFVGGDVV